MDVRARPILWEYTMAPRESEELGQDRGEDQAAVLDQVWRDLVGAHGLAGVGALEDFEHFFPLEDIRLHLHVLLFILLIMCCATFSGVMLDLLFLFGVAELGLV